jgi:hypothetical protein
MKTGNRRNKELLESITCKDVILEEYSKIRHEYNNMLQTITCYIEAEDMDELIKYKSVLLEKTHLYNRNSITQLSKIMDYNILSAVYKLYLEAKQVGAILNIAIAINIPNQRSFSSKHYCLLQECLKRAYESGVKEAATVNLNISGDDNGINFCFHSSLDGEGKKLISKSMVSKKRQVCDNTIFNSFIKDNHYIQEILISNKY